MVAVGVLNACHARPRIDGAGVRGGKGYPARDAIMACSNVFSNFYQKCADSPPITSTRANPDVDRVLMTLVGIRLSYCAESTAWLTCVAESPANAPLVRNGLLHVLSNERQPLGMLASEFASTIDGLFADDVRDVASGRRSPRWARGRAAIAAVCVKMGADRLHRLVLDCYAPLSVHPASQEAKKAVLAHIVERSNGTLHALLAKAAGIDVQAVTTAAAVQFVETIHRSANQAERETPCSVVSLKKVPSDNNLLLSAREANDDFCSDSGESLRSTSSTDSFTRVLSEAAAVAASKLEEATSHVRRHFDTGNNGHVETDARGWFDL